MRINLVLVLTVCLIISATVHGDVKYAVTDLGALPDPNSMVSLAYGINNSEQVVGVSYSLYGPPRDAFIWGNGEITKLASFGGNATWGYGINDLGHVVGHEGSAGAVLWQNGTPTPLGNLPGASDSVGYAINGSGQVVGSSYQVGGGTTPVLWQGGQIIELIPGQLMAYAEAHDINESGQIVGVAGLDTIVGQAFLWEDGNVINLGSLPGLPPNQDHRARAINDLGQVVGDASYHGFIWQDGAMSPLGTIPGGIGTIPYDINNAGQVVGADPIHSAVLWENGAIVDLQDLIPGNSGWELVRATGINDSGYIVGYGYNPSGDERAFLLTPIPEPATLIVFLLGGMGLIRRRGQNAV